jgi:uncharacterized protein (DUF58 family)
VGNYQTYYDPQTLARIKDLELQARQIIEGFVSGAHKSPYQGISVEFAEHREYVPGDDVRHVDWKVFGKTDKYYLKQYEQETNLVCNLVLDISESMKYGSAGTSKLEYGARLAASLAYLVLHQQDSAGLVLFEDQVRQLVPASSQPSHLKQIMHLLATSEPSPNRSRVGAVLNEVAERFAKRSLVVVVSDCFDDLDQITEGLKHLRYKRHEVVVFQILDPTEIDFDFQDMTLFKGLEAYAEVLAEPRGLREAYLEEFGQFLKSLVVACRSCGVDYQLFRTDQPLSRVLPAYLASRLSRTVSLR